MLCGYSKEWCPKPTTIMTTLWRTSHDSVLRKLLVKANALRSQNDEFPTTTIGLHDQMAFYIAVCLKVSLDKYRKRPQPENTATGLLRP